MLLTVATVSATPILAKNISFLNVSYDPTRAFYQEFDVAFAKPKISPAGVA